MCSLLNNRFSNLSNISHYVPLYKAIVRLTYNTVYRLEGYIARIANMGACAIKRHRSAIKLIPGLKDLANELRNAVRDTY